MIFADRRASTAAVAVFNNYEVAKAAGGPLKDVSIHITMAVAEPPRIKSAPIIEAPPVISADCKLRATTTTPSTLRIYTAQARYFSDPLRVPNIALRSCACSVKRGFTCNGELTHI